MSDKLILKELCRYNQGTFADIIYRNALLHGDDEAFVCGAQRITFAQFNARINSLIHALCSLKVKKGDVLGILSWNRLEFPEVYGAAMKGGFIASPFNPRLQIDELEYLINYSEANTLFFDPAFASTIDGLRSRLSSVKNYIAFGDTVADMVSYSQLLADAPSQEPEMHVSKDDPFIIFYTSGTTGVPRGALYTHVRKLDNTLTKALEMGVKPGDKHVMVLPFFHIGGDNHVWPFFIVGGCNVIIAQKSFEPEAVLQTIQNEQATDLQIVPTQLNSFLSCKNLKAYDLSSLRRIYYAASPMPIELLRRGLAVFGPIFSQGYGQSESGPQICSLPRKAHQVLNKPAEEQKVLSSCGQPSLGVHVRVIDEKGTDVAPGTVGEIIAQSDSIMECYWRRPDETKETIRDGWLHTGDMGFYDKKGFIYLVDRKKDMIVSGGENVYSREVEDVLYMHPAVAEAAVIGIPDSVWVERVHALVVRNPGAEATEEELISFCKKRIAHFKAPKGVEFVDSLPKSPQGKIVKKEIRQKYWKPK